ncbi:MAG: cation diffusion facilitator family transporter [Candidatus Izemoplasmatales bacterium]|jgi:cobalt-zinc-cadmium efflux system protein|nr:cation diffusion facilitator family transporter [Candidatus Izemoplasmatales bacterium]
MKSERRMLLSLILNLIFTVFEFIGGLITNSVALLSDAVHDAGDSISMALAVYLEKKSKKKRDFEYTFGYYRFSLLGGLITSAILLVGSTIVIIETVKRIITPEVIDAETLIYFAIFGVVVNGLAALISAKGKSVNERVISLHLLEDVFGWLVLLIGAILMNIFDIVILDAILSLLFSLFILYHVFRNLKKILEVFLEKAPKGFSIKNIKENLEEIELVRNVHHIHLWSIEGNIPIITLHARISHKVNADKSAEIMNELKVKLKSIGIDHSTIQLEYFDDQCDDVDCDDIEIKEDKHHHHHH